MNSYSTYSRLSAREKLTKARVTLNKNKPFFGYLTMRLIFEENNDLPSMGVNKYGKCIYNKDFVEDLDQDTVRGVLAHEVMHCALQHLDRVGGRDRRIWNIATDAVINGILINDGLKLPDDGINPIGNNITLFGKEIVDISSKSADSVYDKIYENAKDEQSFGDSPNGWDEHMYDDENGDEESEDNKIGKDIDWEEEISSAATYSKMQGKLPAGIERKVDKVLGNKIDWRGLLYRYLTNTLPFDYTWKRPNKKSYSTGIYLPDVTKEQIEVVLDLDTSGSISNKDLQEFLGELLGIVNSFENVKLSIIWSDTEVYGPEELRNPTVEDVKKLKPKGGGGTDHRPVFEWVERNKSGANVLINFTDGFTSFPDNTCIDTIWVLAGMHAGKKNIPFGKVVELPRNK